MNIRERAFLFDCAGDELVGVLSMPQANSASTGVLVVVGGPQYRAGSHRLFLLLARHLASQGIPCMRFDYRGMGDATGEQRAFDTVDLDIRAALDAFFREVPQLQRVVLWGLCDGASAACLYDAQDDRVAGVVMLNPWVRTEVTEAKTMLKHYYVRRFVDRAFWRKVLSGRVAFTASARDLLRSLRLSKGAGTEASGNELSLPDRMAGGLMRGKRPFALLLSGRDYVAREFEDIALPRQDWTTACQHLLVSRSCIDDANHTCARAEWRRKVALLTAECVELIARRSSQIAGRQQTSAG